MSTTTVASEAVETLAILYRSLSKVAPSEERPGLLAAAEAAEAYLKDVRAAEERGEQP